MSTNPLRYPAFSDNPNKNRSRFWKNMGLNAGHPDDLAKISKSLLRAPVALYSDKNYIVNQPGSGQEAEGKITLSAAQKILGGAISEGEELVIRMLKAGSSPESSETYDATLEVEEIPEEYRQHIPDELADPLLIERKPDGFDLGQAYDFTVLHHGSDDYILADPETVQEYSIER